MPIKESITKFRFSYGELMQQAMEKSTFLRRDAVILANRGVTANDLDVLDDLITAFKETRDDNSFIGLITDATVKKDAKRKQVEIMGRDILGIAELALGSKSGIYKSFGFVNLGKLNDGEIIRQAFELHTKANEFMSDISAKGLTPAMLTEFRTLIDELDPLVRYAQAIKSDRDANTEVRRNAANALYEKMADLCRAGVIYFQDRDPAKYSDYVLYGKSATSQSRSGNVSPNSITSRPFNGLSPETILRIKNEGTGSLDFYFSTTEGGNPTTLVVTVLEFQEQSYSASEMGYDIQTGAIKFNIRNLSQTEYSSYLIRIE